MTMDCDDKVRITKLINSNALVKNGEKVVRQYYKQSRNEFLEEYNYETINTNEFASNCNEEIQQFDPAIYDAWIVQCPKGIDINALVGKRIKIPGRRYVGDIQVRATPYESPLVNSIGYANKKGKYGVRTIPITGHMVISNRFNMDKPDGDGDQNEFPKTCGPQNFRLPVRHPFFGRDYKERIDIDKKISKKLRNADKKCTEVTQKLHSSSNFYKIRQKLLASTQTLHQKERDVRQSVLTGVAPKFLQNSEHPDYMDFMGCSEEDKGEKTVEKKSSKRKLNGTVNNGLQFSKKEGDVSPKKKKKIVADDSLIQHSSKAKTKIETVDC